MAPQPQINTPGIDPRYACFAMVLRESPIHRYGVYAAEPIPARRKVIEYTGERISRRETRRRGFGVDTYLFTLNDYWTIDGSVGGSGAEYINHSCQPNLRAWICKNHILYMSKRAIEAGRRTDCRLPLFEQDRTRPLPLRVAKCRGAINLPKIKISI